jgi:hypothetical protein
MESTLRGPSALQGHVEMGNLEVCEERICDNTKESVNRSLGSRCHIRKCAYTDSDS